MIQINKNLCVGMFILGALGYYTNEELQKDKHLQYVAMTLRKKHFSLKNGSAKDRITINAREILKRRAIWELHAHIADDAWNEATRKFPPTNAISITMLIFALLQKRPDVKKYYAFNDKKMQAYIDVLPEKNHSFSSLRTASKMLEMLDFQIAHYYVQLKQNEKSLKC